MSESLNFKKIVEKVMGGVISTYSLALVEVSENEVLLKSMTYSIDVVADRDGVSLMYFDTAQKPAKGYNLFLFLVNKRRDALTFLAAKAQTTSYAEFVESELNCLAQHIENAGKDILQGSKDWIRGYAWPIVRPYGDVASLIN